MSFSKGTSISKLIDHHRVLDEALKRGRENFLSEWNCNHPFVNEFLGPALTGILTGVNPGEYVYLDERPAIANTVVDFHKIRESLQLSPLNVLAGAGSSSLLAAFVLWLVKQNIRRIYYLPPIYHTLHYFFRLLRIEAVSVSGKHAFQPNFDLKLPANSSILFLSDPIWYAGKRLTAEVVSSISSWQERTGSLVFVDGSFQHLNWSDSSPEKTASLNMELTFRLICPTKALAIHSFRFSYLLHPPRFHSDLTFLYESLVGSVAAGNLAFGNRAVHVLSTERNNRPLAEFLRQTFDQLTTGGFLRTDIRPDCGYYVFAVPLKPLRNQVAMGPEYFELDGYSDHVRINLMVARRVYLCESSTE